MLEVIERKTKAVPASVTAVERFVTRVWEHPLVDEATRQHRLRGRLRFNEWIKNTGVDKDNCIAFPVGSFVWITNEESDYDLILITNPAFHRWLHQDSQAAYALRGLHFIDILKYRIIDMSRWSHFSRLLLTPDEYVFGNTDIARKLRLSSLRDLRGYGKCLIDEMFNIHYRYWDRSNDYGGGKRRRRFDANLEIRARQSRCPARWKEAFLDARKQLQVPTFEQFQEALTYTGGALHINPRYAALGIR